VDADTDIDASRYPHSGGHGDTQGYGDALAHIHALTDTHTRTSGP
jgi:hypothetical protein